LRIANKCVHIIYVFSSPHLVEVRERIRINGQPISKEKFVSYFWDVYNELEATKVRIMNHVVLQVMEI
jgi:folylpolyglutamate synthase/dihydropteroate synthase